MNLSGFDDWIPAARPPKRQAARRGAGRKRGSYMLTVEQQRAGSRWPKERNTPSRIGLDSNRATSTGAGCVYGRGSSDP